MILCSQHAEVMHSNTDTMLHPWTKAEVLQLHICLREGSEDSAVDPRMSWQCDVFCRTSLGFLFVFVVFFFWHNPRPPAPREKGL